MYKIDLGSYQRLKKSSSSLQNIDHDRAMFKKSVIRFKKELVKSFEKAKKEALKDAKKQFDKVVEKNAEEKIYFDIEDALKVILGQMFLDGYTVAQQQITQYASANNIKLPTINTKPLRREAADWASQNAANLITNINKTTRNVLRSEIDNAIRSGKSYEDFALELQESYQFSEARARTIAVTEMAQADVSGNMKLYKDAGIERKRWIKEATACPLCTANEDEGVVDMNHIYAATSNTAPPGHPNCRCDIVPVFGNETS